jgi:hypothetical protein
MATDLEKHIPKELARLRAECFLLCDYARSENGKLYIVGGGWDQLVVRELPVEYDAYLAMKIGIPSQGELTPTTIRVELLDSHGAILGEPVLEASLDPLQPPDDIAGATTDDKDSAIMMVVLLMAAPVTMRLGQPGSFVLRLVINDEVIVGTTFRVVQAVVS